MVPCVRIGVCRHVFTHIKNSLRLFFAFPVLRYSNLKMTAVGEHRLPFHSSMPTPSSESLSLTVVPAVEAYLANTPFAGQSVTYLMGGTVNYLYRIHLLVPFEGRQTVILKHAQPVIKDWQDTVWDLRRQVRNKEAK